jgi:undecaprenyl-diphosphatase
LDSLQIFLLALVQGLTEFLPISSSAHLILMPHVLGYDDQGLAFDVAVHLGSLAAVIIYFRRELTNMGRDWFRSLGRPEAATADSRMAWYILIATLPIVVIGGTFKTLVATDLRSAAVIAAATVLFGLLLWWYDRTGKQARDEYQIAWKDALVIGLFQSLAIIPGTSRSGITITAGLMLGLTRKAASRFSFLLAVPTIILSGAMVTLSLIQSPQAVNWQELFIGAIYSFCAAYLCIHFFLKAIERIGMLPFVIYRLILGAVIVLFLIP